MRLLPHPILSIALTLIWGVLWNDLSPGTLAFGALLGIGIPLLTAPYWPNHPRAKNPRMLAEFTVIVLWDILIANVIVALAITTRRTASLKPCFVTIPLDLRTPEAITLLACTITMTPGTLSADIAADGRSLLVHCLDAPDPDAVRDEIKSRYERRIREIFE